jgi:hypothetical protein
MDMAIRTAAAADVPAMHRIRTGVKENRLADPARVTEDSYLPYVAAGSAWVAQTRAGIAGFAILAAQHRHPHRRRHFGESGLATFRGSGRAVGGAPGRGCRDARRRSRAIRRWCSVSTMRGGRG